MSPVLLYLRGVGGHGTDEHYGRSADASGATQSWQRATQTCLRPTILAVARRAVVDHRWWN
jgi:hypothetical protein